MVEFSIITVTRNAAATLERSIQSVAKQRHRPIDYIIVDGASSDGTSAIVERYGGVVTRFTSERDEGIYDAMNKGLALARGDFIYFLGADDSLIDDRTLTDVAASLDRAPCDLLYGGIDVRSTDGRVVPFMPPPPDEALSFMIRGCLPHQASFASRRAFDRIGEFDTRYRIAGDYDWFLRVLTCGDLTARRIERRIASYQMGGMSNRLRESQAEAYAIQNALPLYRQADWLKRRVSVFQRALVSQYRQEGDPLRLLQAIFVYVGCLLLAGFVPGHRLEKRIAQLQQAVLEGRLAKAAPGDVG